jgi:hypothetical protein
MKNKYTYDEVYLEISLSSTFNKSHNCNNLSKKTCVKILNICGRKKLGLIST